MSVADITDELRAIQQQFHRLMVDLIQNCQRLEYLQEQLIERKETYEEQDNQLRYLRGQPARLTPVYNDDEDDDGFFSDSLE